MRALIVVVAFVCLAALPVRGETPDPALNVAERLVSGAHGALTAEGLSQAERDARLKETIASSFAFDVWERFLLGERADRLSEAERATFRDLLPGFIAHLYKTQFGRGLEEKPRIRGTRPARRDTLVRAEIPRSDKDPLPVDWRIRDFAGEGAKVIDVMVGGVSFLLLKREEFTSLLDRGGPEALIAHMRENSL